MPTAPPDPDRVTMAETCAILGVTRWTVERRVREGVLTKHATRRGRKRILWFSRAEVLAVLAADQQAADIDDDTP